MIAPGLQFRAGSAPRMRERTAGKSHHHSCRGAIAMLRFLGAACTVLSILALVATASLPAQTAAKKKSTQNLKRLAEAMLEHAEPALKGPPGKNKDARPSPPGKGKDAPLPLMPPATIYSKNGKPLYSWRVAILPELGEGALYKQFKLDEPWDSEHNKKLLEKMPKVFAPVAGDTKEMHNTYYQVVVGKGAAFEDKQQMRFPASFPDGTSNTVLIVEAAEAVPWSKPADLAYDPDKPLPKFGGLFSDGFNAAFADGTVRFIKKDVDEKLMRAVITRAGGEAVDLKKLK
jgi:hypothetical protein